MNIFKKAIKEVKELDAVLSTLKTPKFRKPTPAPKPNPNYIPPASVKPTCIYKTPCHWCSKWDKKCDLKIGCENLSRGLRANANVYDDAIAPCVDCEKHKIDTNHCTICWAHNFNLFKAKENSYDLFND